jgi:hypothetical protein
MLSQLNDIDIKKFDTIFFVPSKENEVMVQSNVYKNPGAPIGGNSIGALWHIILFKFNGEEESVSDLDSFEAIFSDPREYLSGLIKSGWFGVVAKKTTTSGVFIEEALAKFNS